jgi:hypothetical protein
MLAWIALHPGWVGFGLGTLVGCCFGFLLIGFLGMARERDHFEEIDL